MKELEIDREFKSLIPPLTDEERQGLEKSLELEGCRDALVVWNDTILDGHNRYEICRKLGIDFQTTDLFFDNRIDAKIWIIQNQFSRRNLNKYQRSVLALELKPMIAAKAKERQGTRIDIPPTLAESSTADNGLITGGETRDELAKTAQVSHGTLAKVEKIERQATSEQKAGLESGEVSINRVHQQIRTQERRAEKTQKLFDLSEIPVERLGTMGKFPVIYADPPWRYEHSTSDGREVENQYPTMLLDDIKELEVGKLATDDCILFLWATSPKLSGAMEVIKAWGFNYRTCMVWVKPSIGMGYYARQRHELLLIATKGNMLTPEPSSRPDSVIEAPRGKHSKKPEVVYNIIERMYPDLLKVELFARSKRGGWHVWGNESS